MKLSKTLLIFAVVLVAGCNKEKSIDTPPTPTTEPVILKQDIQSLHKAEALNQQAVDAAVAQHKQIDEATQ